MIIIIIIIYTSVSVGSVIFFTIQQKECIQFFKSEKKTFIIFQDSSQNPENMHQSFNFF